MTKNNEKKSEKVKTVRITKKDRKNIKGETNWPHLIAEEKKEGLRK